MSSTMSNVQCIQYSEKILSPAAKEPQNTMTIPHVDWSMVNTRFLPNIPLPQPQPVHGCSSEPSVYQRSNFDGTTYPSHTQKEFQFGSQLGWLKDCGSIGELFAHGYKYEPGIGWVFHAEFLRDRDLKEESEEKEESKGSSVEL